MSSFSLDWRAVSRIEWWVRQCGLKFTASTGGCPDFVHTGGKQGRGNGLNYWQLFNCGKGFKNELRSLHSLHFFGLFCLQNYSIVKSKLKGQACHESGWTLSSVCALHWALIPTGCSEMKEKLDPVVFRLLILLIPKHNFLLLLFLPQEK